MKKVTRIAFPLLLVMLIVVGCVSVQLVTAIGNYGTLINYVGIVRGASQRAVKLEMHQTPDDGLLTYLDGILQELMTGEGPYGLPLTDCETCNANIQRLNDQWEKVKHDIQAVRNGAENERLLADSEELFVIANDTVFSVENYSTRQVKRLSALILLMTLVCIVCGGFVAVSYVKRYWALQKTNAVLADKADRDELTGAFNLDRFVADAERLIRQHSELKFAVLYIDLENFKYINDIFGYQYGDALLRKYAALMMSDLQEHELFARNIADRFVALRCYTERGELIARQQAVDRKLAEQAEALQNKFMITIACGICCIDDVSDKLQVRTLINRANFAQKTVKQDPDVHYGFYNEHIRERMIEEMTLQSRMRAALENHEFVIYFQPKVNPKTAEICSSEALVRWNTPERGMLAPNTFIPVFEKNHLISELDRYVFEQVCSWLYDRITAGKKVLPVSVNVSRLQFYKTDFVQAYTAIRDRYQIPAGLLEIEFTETVAFENQNHMIQTASDLHRSGFRCSLDDFGTGYSSLGILKDLPIDILKLDASFFSKSQDSSRDYLILEGVISLIKALNIHTVAEGVELQEQVDFLKTVGCDEIQGYYYYRPMPAADFEALLEPTIEKKQP